MTPLATEITKLTRDYLDGKDVEQQILDILADPAYESLDYVTRNQPFMTSHKLLEFERCPYFAWLRYVENVPYPIEEQNDHFTIGRATEDAITLPEEDFEKKYVVVSRRTAKTEEENEGKTLLTGTQGKTVEQCKAEYQLSPFAPAAFRRKNVIVPFSGYVLKAEMDSFADGVVTDLKTTADINTFERDMREGNWLYEKYAFQMAFYAFVYEMRHEERVQHAELFVVDKHTGWSRSHKFVLGYDSVLQPRFDRIQRLIQEWKDCEDSGLWPMVDVSTYEGRKVFRDSPYWLLKECQDFKKQIPLSVF